MASSHCPGAYQHWRTRPAASSSSPRPPAILSSSSSLLSSIITNVRPVSSSRHNEGERDNSVLLSLPVQSLPDSDSHASQDWHYSQPILLVATPLCYCYCCCYYYQYNYNNKDSDPQHYLMNAVEMIKKNDAVDVNDRLVTDDLYNDNDKHQKEEEGSEESERLNNDDEDEEMDDRSRSNRSTSTTSNEEEEEDWFELLADGILDGYVTLQDVQRQITAHPEWLGQKSKITGYSLLHCACDGLYSMQIVEYLLRAQQQQQQDAFQMTDLMTGTLMDHNRWTPLHCACDNANPLTLDCVKLLLKFEEEEQQKRQRSSASSASTSASTTFGGSSQWIRARTMAGETPLFLACQSGRTAILHWQFPNTQTIRWLAEQWPLACVLKAASSTVPGSHQDAFSMVMNESVPKDEENAVPPLERYAVRYECPLDVVEDYKEIAEGYFEVSAAASSDVSNDSNNNPFYRMPNQSNEEESVDAEAYLYDINNMDNEADEPLEQDDSKIFLSQLQDSLQANEAQVMEYFDLVEFLTNQTERVENDLVQAAMTHGPYGCITQRDFDELLRCSCCNHDHNHSGTNMKQRSCLRQALSPEPLRQLWDTVAAMHAAGRLDAVSPNATRKHAVQVCAAAAATAAAPVAAAVGAGGHHHHHHHHSHHSRKKKTNAVVDGLWLHLRENPRLCDRQKQTGSENYNNDAKVSKKNKVLRDLHNNEADDESIRHEVKRQRRQY